MKPAKKRRQEVTGKKDLWKMLFRESYEISLAQPMMAKVMRSH